MNYGLLREKKLNPKDYRAGGITPIEHKVILNDGNYLNYLPRAEYQIGVYFDTAACVSFSALNCLETLSRVEKNQEDFSDRFTAKMSGTTKNGNYLSKVAESLRLDGVVPEDAWPYPREQRDPVFNWYDYYSEIPQYLKDAGQEWLKANEIRWEWVDVNEAANRLIYGPLQVTVYAWPKIYNNEVFYTDGGNTIRNHAVELVAADSQKFIIYDSYDKTIKFLSLNYRFGSAIQFFKTPKIETPSMPISLPNDILVQEVEQSGTFALHLDGKLIIGEEGKLLATWLMRNKGKVSGKAIPITKEDWDMFPKINLKGEPLNN